MKITPALTLLAIGVAPHVARADEPPSKDRYWLLRPTPRAELRELSTDRPDTTESPHTVDAGHAQVEVEPISVMWGRAAGDARTHTTLGATNLKLGLTNGADIQCAVRPIEREVARTSTRSGFGDVDVRLKVNLWGNDGGPTALALMPVLTLRTGGAPGVGAVEGGLILPLALELPADFEAGLMLQATAVPAPDGDGYEGELLGSATFSHALIGDLGAFGELAAVWSSGRLSDPAVTTNFGLMYAIAHSYQLDAGANVGLTEAADDLRLFVGFSARF